MAEELIQHVIETADHAKHHLFEMQELLSDLQDASKQIHSSAVAARMRISQHFENLRKCIMKALADREQELSDEVTLLEKTALEPLSGCEELIRKEKGKADQILAEGKMLLSEYAEGPDSAQALLAFKSKVSAIDLNSLPAVPRLQDVACIHVDLPHEGSDIETQLVEAIHEYGHVVGRAPVQITDIQERPGAVLLKWAELEEQDVEHGEFAVRYCRGNLLENPDLTQFTEAYRGHDLQTIVRQLDTAVNYSFQVRGLSMDSWSPWSIAAVTTTTMPHYQWQLDSSHYAISDQSRVITTTSTEPGHLIHSGGATFQCGHSINFHILECSPADPDDMIGLSLLADNIGTNARGVLCITPNGQVFVDGQEKTTKLPPLTQGSVLSFDTEVISANKVRVTAEIDNKIVTLDWTIDTTPPDQASTPLMMMMSEPRPAMLYFFARLSHSGWKVLVE